MLRRESTQTRRLRLTPKQAPQARDEMHASIQQEPALVLGGLPPGSFDVLGALLDAGLHSDAEVEDGAEFAHALGAQLEGVEVAELLCDGEGGFRLVDVVLVAVPLDQLAGGGDVFGHGLLG